jgi:hypothetical protein
MTKTIQLTENQVSAVREVLDIQASRKIGCVAVVNFGFDRTTGERTVELSCLEWPAAVAVCAKIKKLAAAVHGANHWLSLVPRTTIDRLDSPSAY